MKRIISIFLVVVLLVSNVLLFSSCGDKNSAEATECYGYITEAHEICDDFLNDIYSAWYFAIYESGNYNQYDRNDAFLASLKIYNDLPTRQDKIAAENILWVEGYSYTNFDSAVDAVIRLYEYEKKMTKMDELLTSAKALLEEISEDQEGYSTLKSYYVELKSCYDFCKSPNTSFTQLKTIKADYQKNLNTYKTELDLIFE